MKTTDIVRTLYTVSDFVSWQKNRTLILSPSFQRRLVWKSGAKSYLVDTILRGLPIPIIFLRDQKTDLKTLRAKREVVDGQQRIRTVLSYVCPQELDNFDEDKEGFKIKRVHNKELSGKGFSDLPTDLQQRILDYQFSVHVLPSSVDDREVLQLFARMNATGVKLNDQELRNANYFGEFKTLSYDLSAEHLDHWRRWAIFTEYNLARMEEVELTSEFFMMMVNGITGKTQTAINKAYEEYDDELKTRDELEKRFRYIMSVLDEKLGQSLNVSPFQKKTLFYSLFAAVYHLTYEIGSSLNLKLKPSQVTNDHISRIRRCGEKIEEGTAPQNIIDATSLRTTHPSSRKALVGFLTGSKF